MHYVFLQNRHIFHIFVKTQHMKKNSLTIIETSSLYAETMSTLFLQTDLFKTVNIINYTDSLLDDVKQNTPNFLMIGSSVFARTEIYEIVDSILKIDPKIKIIIVGQNYEVHVIRKLFSKGIRSYLDQDSSYEEFLKCVQTLHQGNVYICESAKEQMISFLSNDNKKYTRCNKEPITKREMEVLKLVCDGLSSKDIGDKLFISVNTVETHRKRILMKLNVKNTVGVVKYALENNIFED